MKWHDFKLTANVCATGVTLLMEKKNGLIFTIQNHEPARMGFTFDLGGHHASLQVGEDKKGDYVTIDIPGLEEKLILRSKPLTVSIRLGH